MNKQLEEQITRLILEELSEQEAMEIHDILAENDEAMDFYLELSETVENTRRHLQELTPLEGTPKLSQEQKDSLIAHAGSAGFQSVAENEETPQDKSKENSKVTPFIKYLIPVAAAGVIASMVMPSLGKSQAKSRKMAMNLKLEEPEIQLPMSAPTQASEPQEAKVLKEEFDEIPMVSKTEVELDFLSKKSAPSPASDYGDTAFVDDDFDSFDDFSEDESTNGNIPTLRNRAETVATGGGKKEKSTKFYPVTEGFKDVLAGDKAKAYFEDLGVELPEDSEVKYVEEVGRIIVKADEKSQKEVETVLDHLNVSPDQITIESKFIEITQENAEELGFEWVNEGENKRSKDNEVLAKLKKVKKLPKPQEAAPKLAQAQVLFEAGRNEDSRAIIDQILNENPYNIEATRLLKKNYAQLQKKGKLRKEATRQDRLGEAKWEWIDPDRVVELAKDEEAQRKAIVSAETSAQEASVKEVEAETILAKARILIEAKEYEESINEIEKLLIKQPYNVEANQELAKVYQELRKIGTVRRGVIQKEKISEVSWKWSNPLNPEVESVSITSPHRVQQSRIPVQQIIPRVKFNKASQKEVIDFLNAIPSQNGEKINIIPLESNDVKFTVELDNIPLSEFVRYYSSATKQNWVYEDNNFFLENSASENMITANNIQLSPLMNAKFLDNEKNGQTLETQLTGLGVYLHPDSSVELYPEFNRLVIKNKTALADQNIAVIQKSDKKLQLKTKIKPLLKSARELFEKGHYQEAKYKLQELLELEKNNIEATQLLKETEAKLQPKKTQSKLFKNTLLEPMSTFAIDVDTASYTAARRKILNGQRPKPSEIRQEEFLNYFNYNYPTPKNQNFAVDSELLPSPFIKGHHILRIGVQGKRPGTDTKLPSNTTFVIDTSGSMAAQSRLPLIQNILPMLLDKMNAKDKVSILSCDINSRLVADRTPLTQKDRLKKSIASLQAVGATNLEQSLLQAYKHAAQHYENKAMNRIVLISDGVANLGETAAQNILSKVEELRKMGITITVIGMGQGNYNDNFLETLANKADGSYIYIDSYKEAKKAFVDNFSAHFQLIARDVKIQVELDPNIVESYRLIGYDNRRLRNQDFRNDKVDGGEVGAGQSVTALYEIKLAGSVDVPSAPGNTIVPMRKANGLKADSKSALPALGEIRLRFKDPIYKDDVKEFAFPLNKSSKASFQQSSKASRLALLAATFAEYLRGGDYAQGISKKQLNKFINELATEMSYDNSVQELKRLITLTQ